MGKEREGCCKTTTGELKEHNQPIYLLRFSCLVHAFESIRSERESNKSCEKKHKVEEATDNGDWKLQSIACFILRKSSVFLI